MGQSVHLLSTPGGGHAYAAVPDGGAAPGVVILHAWWGLTEHFTRLCDRFAREGFAAVAPDLYRGPRTDDPAEARRLSRALDSGRALADAAAAIDYLRARESVENAGLGVVGFSMGAELGVDLSVERSPDVRGLVLFYGLKPRDDFAAMRAAVQCHLADQDEFVTDEEVREFESGLRQAGRSLELFTYPGTRHAFFNGSRPEAFDAAAADLAWRRTLAFLSDNLRILHSNT